MLQNDIVAPHQDVTSTDTCPTDVTSLIKLPPVPSHSCQLLSVIDSKTKSVFLGGFVDWIPRWGDGDWAMAMRENGPLGKSYILKGNIGKNPILLVYLQGRTRIFLIRGSVVPIHPGATHHSLTYLELAAVFVE